MTIFIIEDEVHAEWCGEFSSFVEAMREIEARSQVAWDTYPNVCPCTSWRSCRREYSIVEFDASTELWEELARTSVLTISSAGIKWEGNYGYDPPQNEEA